MSDAAKKILLGLRAALALLCLAGCLASWPAQAQTDQGHDSLSRILITSEGEQDGRVVDGYVIRDTKNFGPLGSRPVKDTPYTVNVVGEDFMNNIGSMTPRDVFRRIPGVEDNAHSEINLFSYVRLRGFQASGTQNLAINGIPTGNIGAILFTEDLSSIEVFSGLTGFMYGVGNVGGTVNYNTKRAIYERANKIRYGTYNNGSLFAHADLGGPIIDNKLAYRLNLLLQDGKTAIKPQSLNRKLISGAIDWKVSDDFLLQFHGSYGEHYQQGRQGAFTAEWDNPAGALKLGSRSTDVANRTYLPFIPQPPDPEKLWVSQDTFNDYKSVLLGLNFKYRVNDMVNMRGGLIYNRWKRDTLMTINYFTPDPDIYIYGVSPLMWDRKHTGLAYYLDLKFNTGNIEHNVTAGLNSYFKEEIGVGSGGSYMEWFQPRFSVGDGVNVDLNSLNLFGRLGPKTKQNDTLNYNIVLSDNVKFNDQWEIVLGLNRSTIRARTFNTTGVKTSEYLKTELSPTAALLFKPQPWLTTYASYIESLESAIVPDSASWKNRNQPLEPTVSRQYEAGAKAELGGMFLTLALYEVRRAVGRGDNVTKIYAFDGLSRHRGVELSAQGRLFDSLNVYGGVNFNSAKAVKATSPLHVGKDLPDAPKFTGKLYLEYDLPFMDGLTLTGSVNHYGKVFTNSSNNLAIPGHTIGDVGFRWAGHVLGQDMAFRFNVQNVTNERYWYGGSGSHLVVGQPRSFSFIGEINF
ncbi:MAG: TonB-dependent siderophore receptor [Deltaproteobacteria bacterium]|nr:TonB-dependent siderophore receptor [Deltaproteobacteria bacterium]